MCPRRGPVPGEREIEMEPIRIESAKLVTFSPDLLSTQPNGTWDDNGGEPDGERYLLPLDDVVPFADMDILDGYIVHAYSGDAGYWSGYWCFCGFSSRDVAYTTDRETAEAIAHDEYNKRAVQDDDECI